MQSVAEQLATLSQSEVAEVLRGLSAEHGKELLYSWRGFNARPEQIAPDGDWDIWLALAGRGWGKTETGAQWVREIVDNNAAGAIALVAETAADARDVMVARIIKSFPPGQKPDYVKSVRCITFHNGAKAWTYNATEPDQLRGPEHDAAWSDELAKWRYARDTWDMLQFGLRLGAHPRQLVTTTPRPIEIVKAIVAGQEGKVAITRGKTSENAANLAARFLQKITARYAGTRMGRQELDAEILGDIPNAIWSLATLDAYRLKAQPELKRIVVAVDPAASNNDDSDEHGIIVGGITDDRRGIVIEDASLRGSPLDWGRRTISLYRSYGADGIVVEVNQGGDMVKHVLNSIDPGANVIEVRASRGKHVRAEPIASLYEQGRCAHVGSFPELETQMTQMTMHGYVGAGSPDRVDALVWMMTELLPEMVDNVPDAARFEIPNSRGGWMSG